YKTPRWIFECARHRHEDLEWHRRRKQCRNDQRQHTPPPVERFGPLQVRWMKASDDELCTPPHNGVKYQTADHRANGRKNRKVVNLVRMLCDAADGDVIVDFRERKERRIEQTN